MKKLLFCLIILAALLSLSCATTPEPTPAPAAAAPPASTPPAAAPTPAPPPPAPPPPVVYLSPVGLDMSGAADYTVKLGDFLSEITRAFYGSLTDVGLAGTRNGFYYPVLLLASEGQIQDPDFIVEGMKIKIPDLKRNLENPESRKAIKDVLTRVAAIYRSKNLPAEEAGLLRLAESL